MRKIYALLTSMVLIVCGVNAQTYFSESFEGTWYLNGNSATAATDAGPNAPSGWTQTRTVNNVNPPTACSSSGGKDWQQSTWSTGTTWASSSPAPSGCSPFGGAPSTVPNGTKAMWFYDGWCSSGNTRRIESPAIDLSAASTPIITFSYSYAGSGVSNLVGSLDGGTTWNTLSTIAATSSGVWVTKAVAIPAAYKVSNAKFGFQIASTFGSFDVFIDNVVVKEGVPGNAAPINMTFASLTGTSFTLGWTDNSTNETSFNVYRSTDGTNYTLISSPASTTSAGTGTAYTLSQTGLTPGVQYSYKIASVFETESGYLTGSQTMAAAATYYYVGPATGDIATAANWYTNPTGVGGATRATPLTSDILIVDGATTVAGSAVTLTMAASASIGALQITNSTPVTITSTTSTQ